MAAVTISVILEPPKNSLSLFPLLPHLFAMKWFFFCLFFFFAIRVAEFEISYDIIHFFLTKLFNSINNWYFLRKFTCYLVQGGKIICISPALNNSMYIIPYSTFNQFLTIGLKYFKTSIMFGSRNLGWD